MWHVGVVLRHCQERHFQQDTTTGLLGTDVRLVHHVDKHIFSSRDDQHQVQKQHKAHKAKPRLPNQISIHNADWLKSRFWNLFQCGLVENSLLFLSGFTGLLSLLTWLKDANMCSAAKSNKKRCC